MSFASINVDHNNGVLTLRLHRPESLNSIDMDTLLEIKQVLEQIEHDTSIRVLVITGEGRTFSSGGDLKATLGYLKIPGKMLEFRRLFHKVLNSLETLRVPVIAVVNGSALAGGLELVMACDIIIAAEDAQLGDTHANWGFIAGGGGTQRLPRLVGALKAKELMLMGDPISGKEAERIGLVNKAVPREELDETVDRFVQRILRKGPLTVAGIKSLVNRGRECDLTSALEMEIWAIDSHMGSQEASEGITAFLEKRRPMFRVPGGR